MKITGILVQLTLVLAILTSCMAKEKSVEKPNIIYILADDLGYAEVECYGQEKIETPNIDALASNGMRFTQHYAGAPVCAPSRCVLLTGKHAGHAQIRGNDELLERGDVWDSEAMSKDPNLEGQRPLKAGTKTIGRLLQSAGYKTGIAGKWGLGGPLTEGIPNKQGFDFFYGYNCQRQAHTYFPPHLWKDTTKVILNNKMIPLHVKLPKDADLYNPETYADFWLTEYAPELIQKEVIQFIQENKDQPFFMYYANPIPHHPLQAPKRWIDYYVEKFGDEEPHNSHYLPQRYPKACHAAMISYMDEQVGEIVATLKELGLYENTIIMFTSDNGPSGGVNPFFDAAKPFQRGEFSLKGHVNEGGIRVPMIAQWPGKIAAGTETDLISAFYDVLPTLCDVAEVDIPDDVDGKSFLPTLLGKSNQQKHEFLYWEFPRSGGQQAVRMGKWKGIRKNIKKDSLRIQLYNLEEDIQELNDVSFHNSETVQKIENIFKKEHEMAEHEIFRMKALDKEKLIFKMEGNPLVRHISTTDPDVHVWDDVVWMYCSQDHQRQVGDKGNYDHMDGYHAFSSTDMIHWTDHGEVLHTRDIPWANGGWLFAPGAAHKNGKYYIYFPVRDKEKKWKVGVAVSDAPDGPFKVMEKPLKWLNDIDPMCFIDDDGQAFLYNNRNVVAKLKSNMLELAEKPRKIVYASEDILKDPLRQFCEGSYMHKKDGIYYYSYTNHRNPEIQGYYAMGSSPYGPFEWKGAMAPAPYDGAQDHHSIIEYKGQWYYFYHIGGHEFKSEGWNGYRRIACFESLYYNEDGTIQMIKHTKGN